MNTAGAAVTGRQKIGESGRARLLGLALMSEILSQEYAEPDGTPVFGKEALELGLTRAMFDDVDDYHGWTESPPQKKDGTVLTDYSGWRRTVTVQYVRAADLNLAVASDYGIKKITVRVIKSGAELASFTAVRTGAKKITKKKTSGLIQIPWAPEPVLPILENPPVINEL